MLLISSQLNNLSRVFRTTFIIVFLVLSAFLNEYVLTKLAKLVKFV
jgi:hypothetical protein